ncbi:MAG: hypothetical protein ACYCW6_00150 [Candidatus Xenobia bacterium]
MKTILVAILVMLTAIGVVAQSTPPAGRITGVSYESPDAYKAEFDGNVSSSDVYSVQGRDGQQHEVMFCSTLGNTAVVHPRDGYHLSVGDKLVFLRHASGSPTIVTPTPIVGPHIALPPFTDSLSASGTYYYVEGQCQNDGTAIARWVKVTVVGLNSAQQPLAIESAYADPTDIGPGQSGYYKVMVRVVPGIQTWDVRVHWEK